MRKLLVLFFCLTFGTLTAQDGMEVRRAAKLDRNVSINNVYVDENGNKWVADNKGLFLVQSADFADPVTLNPEEWSLLSVPDGNQELYLSRENLERAMDPFFGDISTAHYDKLRRELWIGTAYSGIYRFKVEPKLELIETLTTKNSKLRSNTIQTIHITPSGDVLIGTFDGLLVMEDKKSKLLGKFFSIEAIAYHNRKIWVVSDGEVLEVDDKGDFYYLETDSRMIEGKVEDIAFDSQGRLWIASEIVVRYDLETKDYDLFGPAQEFTSQNVNCIAVDFDDALWVGTRDKGLYFIGKSSSLLAEVVIDNPLDCTAGARNASLKVRASGGQPPYTYTWIGGLTGENPEGLGAGTYTVTVSDQQGRSTTAEATIKDSQLTVDIKQRKAASSGGANDGQAIVTISPGNTAYDIRWDNGEKGQVADELSAGEHSVTITGKDGCSTVAKINISEELAPLSVSLEQTGSNNCPGDAAAAVKAVVSGGQAPYTYQWNKPGLEGDQAGKLPAGSYALTVTDANEASAETRIEIAEPAPLIAEIDVLQSATTNNADGQAVVRVNGGTGGYSFQWDTGEASDKATQLAAGTHSVTITDSRGCSTTAAVEITEDILPLAVRLEQIETINCTGEQTGAIALQTSGGKAPFEYQWSTDKGSGESATGLAAGSYQVTVTDVAGNTSKAEISVTEPEALTASITPRSPASTNSADGKAKVTAKGGNGKYTYRWDTGETGETAEQLAAGTHTVTVTDEAGCTTTATVEIGEDILPLAVELEPVSTIRCTGESTAALSAAVSGGKAPFEYQWSTDKGSGESATGLPAGSYQVTVTDVAGNTTKAEISVTEPEALTASITPRSPASTNSADGKAKVTAKGGNGKYTYRWDTGETGETAEQLAAGTHTVTVTDEAGCITTATVEIGEDILPLAVELEPVSTIRCTGESTASLSAAVSGGKAPFEYSWSTGKGSGETATGLSAGDYQVTVTDVAGNTANAEISVTEPEALTASITPRSPASTNSADGKAKVIAKGGNGKYTYRWDTGETGETAEQLAAGTHTVTVSDETGCTTTASVEVGEDILPLAIELEPTATIKCTGESTASLSVAVSGGKSPFQYAWSTGKGSGETATELSAGEYQVTVTDVVGTSKVAEVSISEPQALSVTVQSEAPASTNNSDGKATARGQGGTGSYSFLWDNGETTATATSLAPGSHTVTLTDGNGCKVTGSVDITENIQPLAVSLQQTTEIKCAGEQTAALIVDVRGGKPPFQFEWNKAGLDGRQVDNLGAGTYTVTVSDASGLNFETEIEVKEPTELTATLEKNRPVTNENTKDGKASLKIEGGIPAYEVVWDNGEGGLDAQELEMGTHSVTVTDANGCSVSLDFETGKKILPALTADRLSAGQVLQVSQIYFEADSTKMVPDSYPAVKEISDFLQENPLVVIEVGGHTNNIPPHEFCDWLSAERAKSVATYIVEQGVDPNRVVYKGYGKRQPKYTNRTEDGRRRNQRVEIKILRLE